jgi:UDP-glucose 4-epimerase
MYEPGTQARNFVHVKDVARAYARSAERLLEQLTSGETGTERFEIASEEDLSVIRVGEIVQKIAREDREIDVDTELVENPRSSETMVEEFGVEISVARERLGREPNESVAESVRDLLTPRSQIRN